MEIVCRSTTAFQLEILLMLVTDATTPAARASIPLSPGKKIKSCIVQWNAVMDIKSGNRR
jgi:hypothetical protein